MKNTITPLLIAGLLLSGCSSIPIEVNEGRIKAETFSFIKPVNGVKAKQSEAHGYNATIQAAVIDYLGNKGIKHVKTGADMTVGYMIVVRSAVTPSSRAECDGLGSETGRDL